MRGCSVSGTAITRVCVSERAFSGAAAERRTPPPPALTHASSVVHVAADLVNPDYGAPGDGRKKKSNARYQDAVILSEKISEEA